MSDAVAIMTGAMKPPESEANAGPVALARGAASQSSSIRGALAHQ